MQARKRPPKSSVKVVNRLRRELVRSLLLALPGGLARHGGAQAAGATVVPENQRGLPHAPLAGVCWSGPVLRGSGWLEWRLVSPWKLESSQHFDPDQFDIECHFQRPDQNLVRVTGFWMREPEFAGWVLRLLPAVAGHWQAVPQVRIDGEKAVPLGAAFSFWVDRVVPGSRITVDPAAPRYFSYEDGRSFVPIGLNVCWSVGRPREDFSRWFQRLAENGGNFARLWMSSWCFGIEWKDTGLGNYQGRMQHAADLDAVLEMAERYGIKVMLCLLNHGAFTTKNDTEWKDNPYNQANGGPLYEPGQFVHDERAMTAFEGRVRYIAARWSHSPALHSWEWWNEVNWTPIPDADLRPWFERMDRTLRRHDPYRRLRSSSWARLGDPVAWRMPEMDFAQQHDYTRKDLAQHYRQTAQDYRARGIEKPLLPGELGLSTTWPPKEPEPYPWDAVHLHNGLWAPLFNGYAGTALYWWWNQIIDPGNLWPSYRGISNFVQAVQDAGLHWGAHQPQMARASGGPAGALAMVAKTSVLLWVRSDQLDVQYLRTLANFEFPVLASVRTHLEVPWADGPVTVKWFDCDHGQPLQVTDTGLATVSEAGQLTLDCPPFARDIAAIVYLGANPPGLEPLDELVAEPVQPGNPDSSAVP
jgi:hypothetical protein